MSWQAVVTAFGLGLCCGTCLTSDLWAAPIPQDASATTKPTVTVLEVGQEPRRELRLRPTPGQKQRHQMSNLMKMTVVVNDQEQPSVAIPTMLFVLESTVADVADNGDATLQVEYVEADMGEQTDVAEDTAAVLEEIMQSMIGITFKSVVDARGFAKQTSVEMPPGTNPMVRQQIEEVSKSLDQMISPLPEEAVGVGAKWQMVAKLESSGMKMLQTTTFTIMSIDDDVISVSVDVKQTADPQEIQSPAAPGVPLRLESFQASGNGKTRLDLRAMMPTQASVQMQVQVVMGMESFGDSFEIGQTMSSEMRLEALPQDAK